jgi:hypothetical protein
MEVVKHENGRHRPPSPSPEDGFRIVVVVAAHHRDRGDRPQVLDDRSRNVSGVENEVRAEGLDRFGAEQTCVSEITPIG